jgi:O-glycosyl hydrolase
VRSPAAAKAGTRILIAVTVRNRTARWRAARVTISLRSGSKRHIVARRRAVRIGAGRRARLRLQAAIPRSLSARRYAVVACVRASGVRERCRAAARRVAVRAPDDASLGPSPQGGAAPAPAAALPGPAATASPSPSATPDPVEGSPRGVTYQTMDGFGASERVFDDPHVFENFDSATGRAATVLTTAQQDAVLDALYRELGLTRIRPVLPETAPGAGIEPSNDDANPYATNLDAFDFSWKSLDAHAAHVARAQARGVATAFLSPLNRERWMGVSTASDVAEYSEWLLALVRRFKAQGGRLTHLSVANEPSYGGGNPMSGAFVRDVIKELAPRLAAEGLLVPFVIPDDVRSSDAAKAAAVILADPAARQYVGALATHLYDEGTGNLAALSALADQYDLPLWMTEFSSQALGTTGRGSTPLDWAVLMHDLIADYDVSAIDYMWGFFGQWDGSGTMLVRLNYSGATYSGFTRTKSAYYLGQFSRFVKPGARRVAVTTSAPAVKTTAYWRGRERALVAINPTVAPIPATLTAEDLAGVPSMAATRTSATEDWAQLPAVAVSGKSVTLTLPPGSVTTLTGTAAG